MDVNRDSDRGDDKDLPPNRRCDDGDDKALSLRRRCDDRDDNALSPYRRCDDGDEKALSPDRWNVSFKKAMRRSDCSDSQESECDKSETVFNVKYDDFGNILVGEEVELVMKTDEAPVTFDDILMQLGEFGTEQKINYFLFSLPYVFTSMQLLGWVFVGADLPHRCAQGNTSYSDLDTGTCRLGNSTGECEVWEYDRSVVKDSVVADWNLVCDREGLRATVGAAPMVGYLFGGLLFGILTDKIGRKPTFFIANILMVVGGICGAMAPELIMFTASRIVAGCAIAGVEASCFVMGMELVGPSKRTLAGIICWFFETSGLLCTVALARLFSWNWRLLQTLYSAPALLFLAYWWVAPESIRWLVARGRSEEARCLILRAARRNKVNLPEELIDQMERSVEAELAEVEVEKTYTALDLFRYRNMRHKTVILLVCWVTCASMYYVLLLDQSELSDNPYTGFLITALVQLPGYFYVIFTLERPFFGRKKSMCGFLILCGVMMFIHPLVPDSFPTTRLVFSVIGRFAANCSYTILNLFSAEQFPTVVRGVGMSFSVVVSRIGTILAPYILLLGKLSPCLFGIAAFLSGLLVLMLPETLGHPMPETLMDGEDLPVTLPFRSGRKEKASKEDNQVIL